MTKIEHNKTDLSSKEEILEFAKEMGLDEDVLLKAIANNQNVVHNMINRNYEVEDMDFSEFSQELFNNYRDIKTENRIINNKIENMKWLLTVLISVFGIITPLLFTIHSRYIDSKFDAYNSSINAYNTNINSKFEIIQQELNTQKEINQLQIQRDVSQEILKYKR